MMMPIGIIRTGLVTSVGLSAPAACAAIRAGITNPTKTRFLDSEGEPLLGHQVPLERPWRGLTRLTKMAGMTILECLDGIPEDEWSRIPLLLCVAERERPGRLDGLEDALLPDIRNDLGVEFDPQSSVIPQGRVSVAVALVQARDLIITGKRRYVVVAAVDSLLTGPTLGAYERDERLLTARNSNGFMPGEGASALLIAAADAGVQIVCTGIGFGVEAAHIGSGQPLRADGLVNAHRAALAEAECTLADLLFRVTDLSGEQSYFKEADLALSRLLRVRQEDPQLWHPSEITGACGAAIGGVCLAVVHAAFAKRYAPGPAALVHFSADAGQRASMVVRSLDG